MTLYSSDILFPSIVRLRTSVPLRVFRVNTISNHRVKVPVPQAQ